MRGNARVWLHRAKCTVCTTTVRLLRKVAGGRERKNMHQHEGESSRGRSGGVCMPYKYKPLSFIIIISCLLEYCKQHPPLLDECSQQQYTFVNTLVQENKVHPRDRRSTNTMSSSGNTNTKAPSIAGDQEPPKSKDMEEDNNNNKNGKVEDAEDDAASDQHMEIAEDELNSRPALHFTSDEVNYLIFR
jgi:hypothetical protein